MLSAFQQIDWAFLEREYSPQTDQEFVPDPADTIRRKALISLISDQASSGGSVLGEIEKYLKAQYDKDRVKDCLEQPIPFYDIKSAENLGFWDPETKKSFYKNIYLTAHRFFLSTNPFASFEFPTTLNDIILNAIDKIWNAIEVLKKNLGENFDTNPVKEAFVQRLASLQRANNWVQPHKQAPAYDNMEGDRPADMDTIKKSFAEFIKIKFENTVDVHALNVPVIKQIFFKILISNKERKKSTIHVLDNMNLNQLREIKAAMEKDIKDPNLAILTPWCTEDLQLMLVEAQNHFGKIHFKIKCKIKYQEQSIETYGLFILHLAKNALSIYSQEIVAYIEHRIKLLAAIEIKRKEKKELKQELALLDMLDTSMLPGFELQRNQNNKALPPVEAKPEPNADQKRRKLTTGSPG